MRTRSTCCCDNGCPAIRWFRREGTLASRRLPQAKQRQSLAAPIVQGAKEKDIAFDDLNDFRLLTAGGVVGRAVMVGKPDVLRNEKITVPALR